MYTHFEDKHFSIQSLDSVQVIKETIERDWFYVFPQIFQPETLKFLKDVSESENYHEFDYPEAPDIQGREKILNKKHAIKVSLLMKNPGLYAFISKLLPDEEISNFNCRIFKLPDQNYLLDWHDDGRIKNRKLSISVNLCDDKYNSEVEGGEFLIREKTNHSSEKKIRNNVLGQAVVFRVLPDKLEHRVNPPVNGTVRTHLAGWFSEE